MIGMTRSAITYIPLLEQTKEMSEEHTAAEYRIAASTNTRNMGMLFFVARVAETLRSIVQTRYASNPELNKLVAIVKEINAVIHCGVALRKKFVELSAGWDMLYTIQTPNTWRQN